MELLQAAGAEAAGGRTATKFTAQELADRMLHRRAVEAVIWGMPAVNYERMLQAAIEDIEVIQ